MALKRTGHTCPPVPGLPSLAWAHPALWGPWQEHRTGLVGAENISCPPAWAYVASSTQKTGFEFKILRLCKCVVAVYADKPPCPPCSLPPQFPPPPTAVCILQYLCLVSIHTPPTASPGHPRVSGAYTRRSTFPGKRLEGSGQGRCAQCTLVPGEVGAGSRQAPTQCMGKAAAGGRAGQGRAR